MIEPFYYMAGGLYALAIIQYFILSYIVKKLRDNNDEPKT